MQPTTAPDGVTIRVSDSTASQDRLQVASDADHVFEVGPTGCPAIEPLVTVTHNGETAFYPGCSPAELESIVADGTDESAAGTPAAVVEHASTPSRMPAVDLPGLRVGKRELLAGCGWRRPTSPADHTTAGGFTETDQTTIFELGETLRGRGWGDLSQDEAVADTWRTARDAAGTPVVVVNAHSCTADTLLLEGAPFDPLEGATAVAETVGADRVVVYASRADDGAVTTAQEAIEAYPDPPVAIDVVTGPPEYRAAEPTMALEAIEGADRLEARLTPPGPASVGLYGRPTVVHTARTLAALAVALRDADTDEQSGTGEATRVVSVTGDVVAPATVELPVTESLRSVLEAVDLDGEFKAACVGGRFGGVTADLDVSADPTALTEADLGTEGAVHVLSEDRCVLEFVGSRTQYAADENCGRCVPCREGSVQLAGLLRDIYDGEYDPAGIEELVRVMARTSICAFGVQAARPARTAVTEFEHELRAHADGRCPADSCLTALEAT